MKKVLWGLLFITMAILMILGQIIELPSVMTIAFTLFIGALLVESLFAKNIFFTLLMGAIIVVINKETLNIAEISNYSIIASSILLSIGLYIITGSKKRTCDFKMEDISYEESDIININVSFGATIKYINSENFKKAFISCNFAGAQVYFDNATIQGDAAEIELDVSFSGVELYIPKNWKIINNVNVMLGEIEEKSRGNETNKTVILTGKASLAGVEIKYV